VAGTAPADAVQSPFSDLLADESQLSQLREKLKALLPAGQFAELETLLEGGSDLPQLAEFAADLQQELDPEDAQALFALLGEIAPQRSADPLSFAQAAVTGLRPPGRSGGALPVGEDVAALVPQPAAGRTAPLAIDQTLAVAAQGITPAADYPQLAGQLDALQQQAGAQPATVVGTTVAGLLAPDAASSTVPMGQLGPLTQPVADVSAAVRSGSLSPAPLTLPITDPGWDKAVGERLLWMVGRSVQGASLRISPAHLGPIDIQLSIQQDQASVSFQAQHALTKEALEAAIPRLREMFNDSNLQLANVDVGQRGGGGQHALAGQHAGGGQTGDGGSSNTRSQSGTADGLPAEPDQLGYYTHSDSLLDDYA